MEKVIDLLELANEVDQMSYDMDPYGYADDQPAGISDMERREIGRKECQNFLKTLEGTKFILSCVNFWATEDSETFQYLDLQKKIEEVVSWHEDRSKKDCKNPHSLSG